MATLSLGWMTNLGLRSHKGSPDRAKEIIREAYQKSGGKPTPELLRVYGEYLKYKRLKAGARKD